MRGWILSAALHGGILFWGTLLFLQGDARPYESPAPVFPAIPQVEPEETRRHLLEQLEQKGDPRLREAPEDKGHGRIRGAFWNRPQVTDSSITAALRWLARHQDPDGGWSAAGFGARCAKSFCPGAGQSDYDEALTALSLLAFLRAGFTPYSREEYVDSVDKEREVCFGRTVKAGLKWLVAQQDADGGIGGHGSKPLVNHAWATLALCEAYGAVQVEVLRGAAQKALDYLVAAQNPGSGWRYSPQMGESDTAVTGLAVLALHAAAEAGLPVPVPVWEGALGWFRRVIRYGPPPIVRYWRAEPGKAIIPGVNEQFADHPALPAIASLGQFHIRGARELSLIPLISEDPPVWAKEKIDFYYWHLGASALTRVPRSRDADAGQWLETVRQVLVENQKTAKEGCANGSWDPGVDRWGSEGGRVYAVAMNCLTLEVPFEERRRRLERSQWR